MSIIPEVHDALRRAVERGEFQARRRRRWKKAGAFVGISVMAAGTAVAAGVWTPTLGTDGQIARSERTSTWESSGLGVLRRAPTAEDRSERVERALKSLSSASVDGINVAGVRLLSSTDDGTLLLVPVDETGRGVAAVQRKDQLCLVFVKRRGDSENCESVQTAEADGIKAFLPGEAVPGARVKSGVNLSHHYGLVPDGVVRVEVSLQDGTTIGGAVDDNAYDLTTSSLAAAHGVRWITTDGRQRREE